MLVCEWVIRWKCVLVIGFWLMGGFCRVRLVLILC